MDTKHALRKAFRERRNALAAEEVRSKSINIARRLSKIEAFYCADAILTYVSMGNEVDTHGLIDRLLKGGRTVFVPRVDADALSWSSILALDELELSAFGVLQPPVRQVRTEVIPAKAPVLVPGLVFTRDGYRVGYGKAFFDRFLPRHEGPAIGLAFECQLAESVPVEPHDYPVAVLVTESGVYDCAAGD